MSQSAYISLVPGAIIDQISLDEIKTRLAHYREQVGLTGRQLGWNYAEAAFPYEVESQPGEEALWFYLKGMNPLYKFIVFGTGIREESSVPVSYIQVVLPEGATHGDKAKANELCKWLGKQLQAEVRLFNGRTIYYNPRK